MKRIISFVMALIMLVGSMSSICLATQSTAVAADALYVNTEWSQTSTPASIEFLEKTTALTWGENAFNDAQTALDAVQSGGTVVLLEGSYSTLEVKKDVTILGAKAGINPNVKNASNEFAPWTKNSKRGSGETKLEGIVHLGMNGDTLYDDDITVTVDGVMLTGNGQLRSNCGKAGKAKLIFKNIYVQGHTRTQSPLYLFPLYSYDVNEYVKDVTIENIRFEGQTQTKAAILSANKLDVSGVFMDADCTKVFAENFTAAKYASGIGDIEWNIHDSMFCNPIYRVIYASWDTAATPVSGKTGVNATIGSYNKVTTTFENNYFINAFASDSRYTLAFRQNTLNTYFNFIGNTFYQTNTPQDNHDALAGYSEAPDAYGAQIKVEKNRFIGNIVKCWSYGQSTTAVDVSGNYYENIDGEVSSIIIGSGSKAVQDWWYTDRACTKRSDGLPLVPEEQLFDIEKDVKWFGRTYTENGKHYFNWTNSGFEVNFNGTGLKAALYSNNPNKLNRAYLKVYVDGEHTQTILLDAAMKTVTLAENLKSGAHTVRVVKRTNGRSSTAALGRLWVDEGSKILLPNESSSRKMQFVGDSITVGYGSLNPNNETEWSTSTEDGTITYAALTAQYFGAENHTIAISGRGIVKNVGGDSNNNAPLLYEYHDWNKNTVQWDHSQYQPDVIVINYGTNDNSAGVSAADFKVGCKAFVSQVRAKNPGAKIIYAYGFMGEPYKAVVEQVVSELNAAGDNKLYYLRLTPITAAEKSIGHPNTAAQADRAQTLIAKVAEITGWTAFGECNYQDTKIQTETCRQVGIIKHTCVDCGKVYTTEIPRLKHTVETELVKEPTQSAKGSLAVHCFDCNDEYTVELPELNATDYTKTVVKVANCTEDGTDKYTWNTTDHGTVSFTVTNAKLGHKYETTVTAPTWNTAGGQKTACACGDVTVDETIVVAKIGNTSYTVLADAFAAAANGSVISIQYNITEPCKLMFIENGVTVDLNGHTLAADYVVGLSGSAVIDSSADNTGKLQAPKDKVALDAVNGGYMPVYDENGYIFTNINMLETFNATNPSLYQFLPKFESFAHNALAEGFENSGVKVVLRVTWDGDTYKATQNFVYTDNFVKQVVESYNTTTPDNYALAFKAQLKRNDGAVTQYTVSAVVISNTGVEIASKGLPFTAQ